MDQEAKRRDFLAIVQTTYIAHGINTLSKGVPIRDEVRHEISGLGVKNEMCDAVRASYLIPDDLTGVDAADEYISWKLFSRESGAVDPDEQPNWITPGFEGWDR
ncbi:hypothetical protein SAMN04488030_1571 [Aliiroseovarius halocynthiae]|uniref:Uncharacterized protein n=1 Tax=Aliiroseovarius halocynthiae TaxID=985055 RepID=A0A545SWT0_9RHOB|nr:hypothetical protein [Aliiroseovarius halocynthiae]TQV69433.1 hypothetical protein FIL88_07765 [Aliiroseovarius halocynthiae]SMR72827.1 hypothetical protein SAMN04488030_1571 [Aliiroseovarius halocynthiae]